MRPVLVGIGVAAAAVAVLLALVVRAQRSMRERVDFHEVPYTESGACGRCHPAHAESFARTFHRTMTQDVLDGLPGDGDRARLAPFEGELRYGGYEARLRHQDDLPVLVVSGPGGERRFAIERTVGSHHYQQFLARTEEGTLERLPVGYHMEERRLFHMNEAFLLPDPPGFDSGAAILRSDYDRHVTRWNDNCVFCHNVGPSPGLDLATGAFDTHVAELGVACEACHGPGSRHARENADPVRRYLLHLTETPDPTIVSPARLSSERSADVCGRCHGQRITDDVGAFLVDGDPFVPGEDLALYSAPLFIDTTLDGHEAFVTRFWSDGTPRLTAYEYQGMLLSRCAAEGELTCTSCHGMHEGDPNGQIRPSRVGDAMCTGCHTALEPVHPASMPHEGVACTSCHMPELVYGIRGIRISHRIDVPRTAGVVPGARPDACVLCHADLDEERTTVAARDGALARTLLGGDPVQRAVAAAALREARGVEAAEARAWLAEAILTDPYPAVRAIAWASLREHALTGLEASALDAAGPSAARRAALGELAAEIGPRAELDLAWVAERTRGRSAAVIEIGE